MTVKRRSDTLEWDTDANVDARSHLDRICDERDFAPHEMLRLAAIKRRRLVEQEKAIVTSVEFKIPEVIVPEREREASVEEKCPSCGAYLLIATNASYMQCPNCRIRHTNLDTTITSFIFGGEPDFAFGNGGKMHHFEEALKNIQTKGGRKVPQEIVQKVIAHIVEQQEIINKAHIERRHVHTALKELGYKTLFTVEPQLFCRITNEPPPFFDEHQEQVLKTMFAAIQAPYLRAKEKLNCDRKQFFPYAYCIYKFLQILGWDSYLRVFGLLPQRKRLLVQEDLFRVICAELGWKFVPLPCHLLY